MSTSLFILGQLAEITDGRPLYYKPATEWGAGDNMKNKGIKKIAIKANSSDAHIFSILGGQLAAGKKLIVDPGLTAYVLPDGTAMEIYSQGAVFPDYLFSKSDQVISYKVADLEAAVKELEAAGGKLLGNIVKVCSTYQYCHLLINARMVIGLYEE